VWERTTEATSSRTWKAGRADVIVEVRSEAELKKASALCSQKQTCMAIEHYIY